MILNLFFFVAFLFAHSQTSEQPVLNTVIGEADVLSYTKLGRIVGNQIIIEQDVDMAGKTCRLPKGFQLLIKKGKVKNGILFGNQTELSCKNVAFKNVIIKGSWNVPRISTALFADMDKENSLKNVFALASPDVKNTIIIEKGDYLVKAKKEADVCLSLPDNTDLFLYGTIRIAPNDFKSYNILQAGGNNISIDGSGIIKGDRYSHKGTEGEWGMGVNVKGGKNVIVKNLKICECWGDCIYIGGKSRNIRIEDCILDDSRRQGVSITNAEEITIRNCKISNIHGTNPQYAIDIEPNKLCVVDHVLIENVTVTNCEGGFRAIISKKAYGNARIGKIEILNCHVMAKSRHTIHFAGCEQAIVKDCVINTRKGEKPILSRHVGKLTEMNNKVINK